MSQCPSQPPRQLAGYFPCQSQRDQGQSSTVVHPEQANISLDAPRRTGHRCLTSSSPTTDTQFTISDMQQLTLPSETFDIADLPVQCIGDPTAGHSSYQANLKTPTVRLNSLPSNDFAGRLHAVGDRLERVTEVAGRQMSSQMERITYLEGRVDKITNHIDALLWGSLPDEGSVGNGSK